MTKVPIDSMCAKKVIQGQRSFSFFLFFSKMVRFFENIAQTKIVEHKIIYKKGPYTFFPKDHHS